MLVAAQEPPPLSLLANLKLANGLASLPGWGVLFFERDHHLHMLHRTVKDWLLVRKCGVVWMMFHLSDVAECCTAPSRAGGWKQSVRFVWMVSEGLACER